MCLVMRPFHHAHQHHRTAIDVEPRIKHQRLKRIIGAALGRRNPAHDRLEYILHANAAFPR